MRALGTKPSDVTGSHPDRLTQILIGALIALVSAAAAIAADLWLQPLSDTRLAQAIGAAAPSVVLPALPATTVVPAVEPRYTGTLPTPMAAPRAGDAPSSCTPRTGWETHIVQQGETLNSLAIRYGVELLALARANCLNTPTIFTGQRLYVPALPQPSAAALYSVTSMPTSPSGQRSTHSSSATPAVAGAAQPSGLASASPVITSPVPIAIATSTPSPTDRPVAAKATPRSAFRVKIPDRYLNIVLLGSDKRLRGRTWRTDTMIIMSVDVENQIVRLLSLPRDLWVHIPNHGYNRINTAELWGDLAKKGSGPERVKQTIYQNLGIPIHYYAQVDLYGFVKIVDMFGGLDIAVDCPLPDIKLKSGMYHMDGSQVLRYARSRKSTNDIDRGRRQRKVLMALWDQVLTPESILKIPQFWTTMADSFETDLPLEEVVNLAYLGLRLKPQHILSKSVGHAQVRSWTTPHGAAVLVPRADRVRALLEGFYTPILPAALDSSDKIPVEIRNGSTRKDAEQLAADVLEWCGFAVVSTGNADRQGYAKSEIRVYAGDRAQGERIAEELALPLSAVQDLRAEHGDTEPAAEIQVILGQDYNPCQR